MSLKIYLFLSEQKSLPVDITCKQQPRPSITNEGLLTVTHLSVVSLELESPSDVASIYPPKPDHSETSIMFVIHTNVTYKPQMSYINGNSSYTF